MKGNELERALAVGGSWDTMCRMVKFSNFDPLVVSSPILPLIERIAHCPVHVAPEREEDLGLLMEKTPFKYRVDVNDGVRGIRANGDNCEVILPLPELERLWAMTFGFLRCFEIERSRVRGTEVAEERPHGLEVPLNLLSWAYQGLTSQKRLEWPSGMPRPDSSASCDGTILESVNRHFLGALGFIIHHEIGHLYWKHPPPQFQTEKESIDCEFVADKWAGDWIFAKCPTDQQTRIFRGDACILALCQINLLEFSAGPQAGKATHPPTIERLLVFANDHIPESSGDIAEISDFPLYLASSILHIQRFKLGLDVAPGIEHESMTDYFINALRVFRERAQQDH